MTREPDQSDQSANTPEAEAAAWDTALRAPDCSHETRAKFKAWKAADPANAEAYDLLQDMLASLSAAKDAPEARSMREAALASTRSVKHKQRPIRMALAAIAAAVMVAAVIFTAAQLNSDVSDPQVRQFASVEMPPKEVYAPPFHATDYGELATIKLSDGSTATLNTDSLIRSDYSDRVRQVHLLKGEASFDVEKDPERPFTVLAGDREITAIGTVFDVRIEGETVEVLLIEGEVDVLHRTDGSVSDPAPVRMRAGERYSAVIGKPNPAPQIAADIAESTLWKEQRVFFEDTPLKSAFAELDRYIEADIVTIDLPGDELLVNGRFNTSDPEAFADDMAQHFGLTIDKSEPGLIRISPAE